MGRQETTEGRREKWRWETGDKRRETGKGRCEKGDKRRKTGEGRWETGEI